MADGFWNRQPPLHFSEGIPKRLRPDFDLQPHGAPSSNEMLNYLPHNNDNGGPQMLKDTKTIGSAYDRYLQNSQNPSSNLGEASNYGGGIGLGRGIGGGMPSLPIGDPALMSRPGPGAFGSDLVPHGRGMGFGNQFPLDPITRLGREVPPLPSDASNTLFVEGLPPDITKREVSHIFRPFLGYKEVRLVNKEPKHKGGDPLVLCFVDFTTPACSATAMNALQGYMIDDHDPDSSSLRLQFARFPGPRSGFGNRGKR